MLDGPSSFGGQLEPTVHSVFEHPPPPFPLFAEAMVRDSFTAPAAPSVSQLNQMEATTLEWLQQEAERVSSKPAIQPPPPSALPDGEWTPHQVLYVRWGEGGFGAGLPFSLHQAEPHAAGTQVHTATPHQSLHTLISYE